MATQQPYHAYAQHSKGTLIPGQTISVNKCTVQVERYLSQGGFAQVYLVRTQAPVYNTTHHVLKHVAVANESMLTEVKKEVDVMRLLRGHPNIVYLIDAAWAKMPNGAFEVYILMEYCPGGGIIDMMNRRLRERLTEAEILQIFVEVCEGVAHMHNSRPPLLHRDLKVENILQSSVTSFKLCDFGSTATVSRPPANSQEMRALEADLNRHTTLQYRAPEMIDLHSRKSIDEKSDVWALGVLLYKLCYYTTPFEEHGPLAILNVQYRFPSYPVYSQQMMYLISSMLREHGPQRPTVFEVLYNVHSLRGTKSAYNYPLPTPTPLSPRHSDFRSNPLDGIVTYRQPAAQATPRVQPTKTPELPVPSERRGRPKSTTGQVIPPPNKPVAQTHIEKTKMIDNTDFGVDGNAAWSSALAKQTPITNHSDANGDEAWNIHSISGPDKATKSFPLPSQAGFSDDFVQKLWASASSSSKPPIPIPSPKPQTYSPKLGPLPYAVLDPANDVLMSKPDLQTRVKKERDAFEGLGLMTPVSKPLPTLGEARKLRTGLATMSASASRPIRPPLSPRLRPRAIPRVSPIPPMRTLEADRSGLSSGSGVERISSSAETRFPSLEELNATFSPNGSSLGTTNQQESKPSPHPSEPPALPPRPKLESLGTAAGASSGYHLLKPSLANSSVGGTRSEQVTGFVMRESKGDSSGRLREGDLLSLDLFGPEKRDVQDSSDPPQFHIFNLSRPKLLQKDQSLQSTVDANDTRPASLVNYGTHANLSKDLLTGDDEPDLYRQVLDSKLGHDRPQIQGAPSKRASMVERNDTLEATMPQHGPTPSPPTKVSPVTPARATPTTLESMKVPRFVKAYPAIDTSVAATSSGLTENWSPVATTGLHTTANEKNARDMTLDLSSSEDEGPEEPTPSSLPSRIKTESLTKRKGRQSSVHDLVGLWGGGVSNTKDKQFESPVPFKQAIKTKSAYTSQPRPPSPQQESLVSTTPIPSRVDFPSQPSPSIPPSPSPRSNRTRPQSMFIFPSRSTDNSTPSPAALQPPDDVAPRSIRRTSISDMVQRYEAIEASTRVTGNATSLSHTNPTKPLTSARERSHGLLQPAKASLEKAAGLGVPSTITASPVKRRTSPTVPHLPGPQKSQRISPASPNASRSTRLEDSGVDNISPHSRNTPILRSEPTKLPVANRKPMMSVEEFTRQTEPSVSTTSLTNERSSSPERPYQGVGKLIDQWQRKSAEGEASRTAILSKRASLVPPKRISLIPNHGKGS